MCFCGEVEWWEKGVGGSEYILQTTFDISCLNFGGVVVGERATANYCNKIWVSSWAI